MICPLCKSPLADAPLLAGREVSCPLCQGRFFMPQFVPVAFESLPGEFQELFPYVEWLPTHDARTNKLHRRLEKCGLSGTGVFRRNDPAILPWFIAREAGIRPCRCGWNFLSVAKAAAKGVVEAKRWLKRDAPPSVPQFVKPLSFDPFATDNDCELEGWGNKHSKWDDTLYLDHPGNPDRWQDEND